MLTSIFLRRLRLITNEEMESYCKGEKDEKDSVNDDLESFFESIRLGKEPNYEAFTYFLPKLTEEELKLVERRDTSYLETFTVSDPDVEKSEMMLSESDSKYVRGESQRRTFVIETSSGTSTENSSESLIENLNENSSAKKSCLKKFCNCSLQ